MGRPETDPLTQLSLPPGFRFFPTDEELLVQYLSRKVAGHHFSLQLIAEIDLYKFDPWVLPSKAIFGEKEWYFFSPRDRKYPNGSRPNRVAGTGYWKATGTDKIISSEGRKVGIKKALVFYVGKAPKGTKTNWIMHEYRLITSSRKSGSSKLDDWVLCRIYKKNSSSQKPTASREYSAASSPSSSSLLDDVINDEFFALPRVNSEWASLAALYSVPELGPLTQPPAPAAFNYHTADLYVPSIPPLCQPDPRKIRTEDEVQSGFKSQRVANSGVFPANSNVMTQSLSFFESADPYEFRLPSQHCDGGVFGFCQ